MLFWFVAFLGCTVLSRFLRQPKKLATQWLVRLWPILWTLAATALLVVLVSRASGYGLRSESCWLMLSSLAVTALPVALVPGRWRSWGAAFWVAVLTVLTLGDLLYLRFFSTIVPIEAVRSAHQIWDLRTMVAELLEPQDAILLVLAVAVVLLAWIRPGDRLRGRRVVVLDVAVVIALLVASLPAASSIKEGLADRQGRRLADISHRLEGGIAFAHLYEMVRVAGDRVALPPLPEEDRQRLEALLDQRAAEAEQVSSFGVARGKNLLVVQAEAFPSWLLTARVGEQSVTPFLSSLGEEALVVPRLLDQTSDGRTSDAEYLVLNSLHPLPRGAVSYVHAMNHFVALPQILRRQGYSTLSAHAWKRGFWNRAILHPSYGFETSLFRRDLGDGAKVSWGLADHLFFDRVLDRAEQLPRPFFAFLVSLSMHPPYEELPPGFPGLELGELTGTNLGFFLNAAHYFDAAVRQLFEGLEARGLLEDTVVALYGDHTMEGFDWQRVGTVLGLEPPSRNPAIAYSFVPFLLRVPGGTPHGELDTAAGLIDVGPTLLHVLGAPRPRSFVGRPLFDGVPMAARWKWKMAVNEQKMSTTDRCFQRQTHRRFKRSDCRDLRLAAKDELFLSYAVTAYDLAEELAGEEP